MKKKDQTPQQSRRRFTKAVFTALASTPAVPALIAAQDTKARRTNKRAKPQGKQMFTDHIPPITVRGGSLAIEIRDELKHRNGSGNRPERYIGEKVTVSSQYGYIARVLVLTEKLLKQGSAWVGSFDGPYAYPTVGFFSESWKVELWLWFIQRPYDPNDPHVKIKGGEPFSGLHTLLIESDKEFDEKKAHSSKREYKYKHKGHNDEDYRIYEWRLVNKNGAKLFGDKEDESYLMMIQFHHGV